MSLLGLVGLDLVDIGCQVGLFLGIFLLFNLIQKYFQMEMLSLMIQKNLMIPLVSDSLEVLSKEYADFYDPKKFDDPQVFDDPKEISIGSMDFDNPKLYGDTSIFDVLF